jgi:hypothetical protein
VKVYFSLCLSSRWPRLPSIYSKKDSYLIPQSHPGLLFGLKDCASLLLLCTNAHHSESLQVGFESCVYLSTTTRESGFIFCHTWACKLAHPYKYIPFTWIKKKSFQFSILLNGLLRIAVLWNKWFTYFFVSPYKYFKFWNSDYNVLKFPPFFLLHVFYL